MRNVICALTLFLISGLAAAQSQTQSTVQDQVGKGTTGTIPEIGSPSTFSESSNLSGCLIQANGRYWLTGAGEGVTYALQSGELSPHVHHVVRISGYPDAGNGRIFHVVNIANTGEFCNPQANEELPAIAVTGKTGNQGTVQNETTTHENQNTAGAETEAGLAQVSGRPTNEEPCAANQRPGYPPNWEQVGESRGAAADLAASAEQNEVGAPQGTYGVGSTRPNYQNPGASQEIGGAQSPMERSANTSGATAVASTAATTIQGCVSHDQGQWKLAAGSQTYTLRGNTAGLAALAGHTVTVSGRSVNGSAFQVSGVQDVSPGCANQ